MADYSQLMSLEKKQKTQPSPQALQRSWKRCMLDVLLHFQPAQIMAFFMYAHHIEEDIFKSRIFILAACPLAQLLQRSFGNENALVDDANARTEPFHHF